ncbi:MAG: hypothetical protein HY746_08945 [Elusimicrobia bacterium]|nr:hypothetical protein [Elusimicrobiota bacterium]
MNKTLFKILYEDDDFIAVNKPAGMLSIPARGSLAGEKSLSGLLIEKYGKIYVVHRHLSDLFQGGNRLMKIIISICCAIFLAGCGNYYSVKMRYFLTQSPLVVEKPEVFSGLYLILVSPEHEDENIIGNILSSALKQKHIRLRRMELDSLAFAKRAGQALSRGKIIVKAYRVSNDAAYDPYLSGINPGGVLKIAVEPPEVSISKEERQVTYKDKSGRNNEPPAHQVSGAMPPDQKQTRTAVVWIYKASININGSLSSYPGGMLLDSWDETAEISADKHDDAEPAEKWYDAHEEDLLSAVVSKLVARYLGRPVERNRPVFFKKEDKQSIEAKDLSRHGRWNESSAIWEQRFRTSGDWRDALNMGIFHERQKNYDKAAEYYRIAQEKSSLDKEARDVRWNEIFSDMTFISSAGPGVQAGPAEWFVPRVAVLPFSDETTSVDGPEMLRNFVFGTLKQGGYDLLSLEETDGILRNYGFSQGGQLKAAKNQDLCKWLRVERLFFGHITEFNEIMLGVYNKRSVKGRLSLWDVNSGSEIWSGEKPVVMQKVSKEFGFNFAGQLARGLWERMKKKPLAAESALYARRNIESLPMKP